MWIRTSVRGSIQRMCVPCASIVQTTFARAQKMLNQLVFLNPSNQLTNNLWLSNNLFVHSAFTFAHQRYIYYSHQFCPHYVFKQANVNSIKQLVTRGLGVWSCTHTGMTYIYTRATQNDSFSLSKVLRASPTLQSTTLTLKTTTSHG